MITRYDLIQMLLKEYTCEFSKEIAKRVFDRQSDSFFESELPVKVIRKGYFVIA